MANVKNFTVGCRNFKITPLTEDTASTLTYGTEKSFEAVTKANMMIGFEAQEHRGDDTLLEITKTFSKMQIEFEMTGLDLELMSMLSGGTYSETLTDRDYFCHDLQATSTYFKIAFIIKNSRGEDVTLTFAKCSLASDIGYTAEDKAAGSKTFSMLAVKLRNTSGVTKGMAIERAKV